MADQQTSPTNTREQALQIREAWRNMDPNLTFGNILLAELETAVEALDAIERQRASLEDQLTSVRNARLAARHALWELVKRARSGAKAQYGDDSNEYERFGGTRISERPLRRGAVSSEGK